MFLTIERTIRNPSSGSTERNIEPLVAAKTQAVFPTIDVCLQRKQERVQNSDAMPALTKKYFFQFCPDCKTIFVIGVIINFSQTKIKNKMEKFMFLFRGGENHADNAADSKEGMENMQAWINWMGDLAKKGILVGGEPLQRTGKQVNGKKMVVTDGPFIEGKETVGGYLIVNAKDINEAVEISKGCPIFNEDGKLEVRPIQKMEM